MKVIRTEEVLNELSKTGLPIKIWPNLIESQDGAWTIHKMRKQLQVLHVAGPVWSNIFVNYE